MTRIVLLVLILTPIPACAVTMAWSPVGNPGNAPDQSFFGQGQFGAVGYSYNIGTYDVTNAQYVEFLNAKQPTGADPLFLYNSLMSDPTYGGINYNAGNVNGSKYSVVPGNGNHPVNFVSFYDAIRFANWMNNGQGNGDTESGAYILQGGTPTPINANSITRQTGATVFLPSENEWYKAAYFDPNTNTYNLYPTSSGLVPNASGPTATPNSANYNNVVGNLTDVGAYTGTTSPYGAFDMAGDVKNWNEALLDGDSRGVRSGAFNNNSFTLRSSARTPNDPGFHLDFVGFRVASTVPEPSSLVLAALGFIALAAWRLRRR